MRMRALLALGLILASPAWAQKDALVVDLAADVATMDPQLQWDTESYTVYHQYFRQPGHPRRDRQNRAAGGHGLALRRGPADQADRSSICATTSCSRTAAS